MNILMKYFCTLGATLVLTSCGTVHHIRHSTGEPYAGLKFNNQLNKSVFKKGRTHSPESQMVAVSPVAYIIYPFAVILNLVDTPISAVSGTILLPRDARIRRENQSWCQVVDLEGNPIAGAEMYVSISYPGPRRGYLLTSDENGFFEYTFHTPSADIRFLGARGYYSWKPNHSIDSVKNNFSTQKSLSSKITLFPIKKPVEHKGVDITVKLPPDLRSLDIDLLAEEAMPPFGNGNYADLKIQWELVSRITAANIEVFDIKIKEITVLGNNNGIQFEDWRDDDAIKYSRLGYAYEFPEKGYQESLMFSGDSLPTWSAIARIRSDSVEGAQYVKLGVIHGSFLRARRIASVSEDHIRLNIEASFPPRGSRSREYSSNIDLKTWDRRDARKKRLQSKK